MTPDPGLPAADTENEACRACAPTVVASKMRQEVGAKGAAVAEDAQAVYGLSIPLSREWWAVQGSNL